MVVHGILTKPVSPFPTVVPFDPILVMPSPEVRIMGPDLVKESEDTEISTSEFSIARFSLHARGPVPKMQLLQVPSEFEVQPVPSLPAKPP
jgi:hypothetical protein